MGKKIKSAILIIALLLPACAWRANAPNPCAKVIIEIQGVIVEDKPQPDEAVYLDDPIYFPLLGHPDMKR